MSRPLALTLGEPAGIGPDITLAAWQQRARTRSAAVLCARRPGIPARGAPSVLGLDVPDRVVDAGEGRRRLRARPAGGRRSACRRPPSPAIRTPPARRPRSPRSDARSPTCSPARAAAVVTNPVAKNVLYKAGFAEPGHTEYLAKLSPSRPASRRMAGDDAVVARARGRAGHDPCAAAEVPQRLTTRPDRRDRPHRRARSDRALRHRAAAARGRRPQSACRRRRRAGRGGRADRRARRSSGCAPTASTRAGRCRPTRCSTRPRARPTTPRSACITTRR